MGDKELRFENVAEATANRYHRQLERADQGFRTRAESRYRFMLLAAGLVGIVAPLLARGTDLAETQLLRDGSIVLLIALVVGVVEEAVDRLLTRWVQRRLEAMSFADTALRVDDEQQRLLGPRKPDKDTDYKGEFKSAHKLYQSAVNRATWTRTGLMLVFYVLFVIGLVVFVYAFLGDGVNSVPSIIDAT